MLSLVSGDKQKTALVCFLSGNITLLVFLAWETHSTCALVGFPAKKTTCVIFPLKNTRAVFWTIAHAIVRHDQ
jgi:hypothetical protein